MAAELIEFINQYRRVHGKPPKLRECVERFDGKLLNVLAALWELRERGLI